MGSTVGCAWGETRPERLASPASALLYGRTRCAWRDGERERESKVGSWFPPDGCVRKWRRQLQQAGRDEERSCRFCQAALPTWAKSLLANEPAPASGKSAVPIMAVRAHHGVSAFIVSLLPSINCQRDIS